MKIKRSSYVIKITDHSSSSTTVHLLNTLPLLQEETPSNILVLKITPLFSDYLTYFLVSNSNISFVIERETLLVGMANNQHIALKIPHTRNELYILLYESELDIAYLMHRYHHEIFQFDQYSNAAVSNIVQTM